MAHTDEPAKEKSKKRRGYGCLLTAIILFAIAWVIVRPGVFTVQPIGALPEGATIIYHSRGSEMPFFSSPDGMCLQMQGSVSLLCRGVALSAASDLIDRALV